MPSKTSASRDEKQGCYGKPLRFFEDAEPQKEKRRGLNYRSKENAHADATCNVC